MKKTLQLLTVAVFAAAAGLVVHKGLIAQAPGYASPYTISYFAIVSLPSHGHQVMVTNDARRSG